ncbi:MAG TPA: tetratricopeptide repeat protein [Planctomycetota bacterium]|nr:tetratricopeptide repeat protein [Planctomycetota bacterium]
MSTVSRRALSCLVALLLALPAALLAAEPGPLDKARDAILHGKYDEGLKGIEALLAKPDPKTEADARGLRIRAFLETGRYKEAIAEGEALTKAAPDTPDALCGHATALIEVGRYDEAAKLLARALERDKDHLKARVLTLELADLTGKQDVFDAQVGYFFALYNQNKAKTADALAAVARAVRKEDPRGAWNAYQEAMGLDPNSTDILVAAGFHTLDKYAWPLARKSLEAALKINPNLALAHAGLGLIQLATGNHAGAQQAVEAARKANPRLILAHLMRAMMLAVDEKSAESLAEINAALAVNPQHPEALSFLAAHYEAVGNAAERDKVMERVLKINPKHAELYTTLAQASERLRRTPAAVAWAKKAIELDPDFWHGYYLAGMNLLRAGEEAEGYRLLDKAFELNKFNVWAFNTLTVLDRDLKKKEFAYHETPHFFVKLDKTEDNILWPYLESLIEPMYDALARKYAVTPVGPKQYGERTLVLLYPKHEEFSARTMGLPGLSALGACLGQVITMPSPRLSRMNPANAFNWRHVLIHEFAHVLTLQKTRYNIPRWFTEGLSVLEEGDTRVNWDPILAHALANNQLLPIEDLNAGFTRPKFPTQVPLCYYHAMLICRYLQETCGPEVFGKMLDMYRDGKKTEEVLPKATGKTLKQLNDESMAYVRRYAEQIKISEPPPNKEALKKLEEQAKKEEKNADLWTQIASGCLAARRFDDARKAAQKAIELQPKLARAHAILGLIALQHDKKPDEARKHLRAAKEADPAYFFAPFHLANLAQQEGKTDEAIAELEAARKIYPRFYQGRSSLQERLADLYIKTGKPKQAIAVLREGTALVASNPRTLVKLAELLAKEGQHAEAAATYLDAIYVDPYDPQIHLAAAKEYEAVDAVDAAIREYAVAAAIEPTHLPTLIARAQAWAVAGKADAVRKALAAVRRLDPQNPEAAKIEKLLPK